MFGLTVSDITRALHMPRVHLIPGVHHDMSNSTPRVVHMNPRKHSAITKVIGFGVEDLHLLSNHVKRDWIVLKDNLCVVLKWYIPKSWVDVGSFVTQKQLSTASYVAYFGTVVVLTPTPDSFVGGKRY